MSNINQDKCEPVEDIVYDRGQDPEYFDVSIDEMLPLMDTFLTQFGNFLYKFQKLNFKSTVEMVAKYDNLHHELNMVEYKLREFENLLNGLKSENTSVEE